MEKTIRNFDGRDVVNSRLWVNRDELVISELKWHKAGMSKTQSGYGAKIETIYKIKFCGRMHRVYCRTYGNGGTFYILTKGKETIVEID